MATAAQVKSFIDTLSEYAIKEYSRRKSYGQKWILPSVCIAQAALETGWGTSDMMVKANAYFGIKAGTSWKGKVYSSKTKECYDGAILTTITDLFRAYDSMEESVADYFELLTSMERYALACNQEDSKTCIQAIWDGGYATEPDYVQQVMAIINQYNLTQYDQYTTEHQEGDNMVKISNCGHDENGRYAGGKAGDQTGTEYQIMDWYSRPWFCVLRFEDAKIADMIADMANKAALNDLIGYDQGTEGNSEDRYSFWECLKESNYDPAQITAYCESDCSASTAAIVKGAGYRLNNEKLKSVSIYLTTYNMRQALKDVGAKVLTDSKYLTSGDYIKAGDILLNDDYHVAIAVTDGPKIIASSSSDADTSGNSDSTSTSNVSSETVAYVARMSKDTKTYIDAGKTRSSLWPELKKDTLVDVIKGKAIKDTAGKNWYLVRIGHPSEGFVREYVPAGSFRHLK